MENVLLLPSGPAVPPLSRGRFQLQTLKIDSIQRGEFRLYRFWIKIDPTGHPHARSLIVDQQTWSIWYVFYWITTGDHTQAGSLIINNNSPRTGYSRRSLIFWPISYGKDRSNKRRRLIGSGQRCQLGWTRMVSSFSLMGRYHHPAIRRDIHVPMCVPCFDLIKSWTNNAFRWRRRFVVDRRCDTVEAFPLRTHITPDFITNHWPRSLLSLYFMLASPLKRRETWTGSCNYHFVLLSL